jgi:hypothetical protein
MSVIEPSYAVDAGMAIQIAGRRLALGASLRPQIFRWLVGLANELLTSQVGLYCKLELKMNRVSLGVWRIEYLISVTND